MNDNKWLFDLLIVFFKKFFIKFLKSRIDSDCVFWEALNSLFESFKLQKQKTKIIESFPCNQSPL